MSTLVPDSGPGSLFRGPRSWGWGFQRGKTTRKVFQVLFGPWSGSPLSAIRSEKKPLRNVSRVGDDRSLPGGRRGHGYLSQDPRASNTSAGGGTQVSGTPTAE